MVTLSFETDIDGTADAVFAAIVDLRGYGRWLAPSPAYAATTEASTDPAAAGTTYVDCGPGGVRHAEAGAAVGAAPVPCGERAHAARPQAHVEPRSGPAGGAA
ncbi:SRPBCC family protein [Actinophytocola sp.]|uniref:SRPBCC family protein n=1 Tax=Actinophytocola sp. TaxID=1872138 RepID=UPI003D6BCFA0